MTTKNPTLKDFEHDMNRHANADYKRVDTDFVLELDSSPTGWQLTVWRAVKQNGEYAPPNNDTNRYAWDAVGRQRFDYYDAGRDVYDSLTTRGKVSAFCNDHPYDGPRKPYTERNYA